MHCIDKDKNPKKPLPILNPVEVCSRCIVVAHRLKLIYERNFRPRLYKETLSITIIIIPPSNYD